MQDPCFSIVIPLYNRPREVRRAIDSCLAQQKASFEVVVVDDASTDQSAAVVESYADARVRLVRHQRNRGECPARNSGVDVSRGEWIVFLDSDHSLLDGALERIRGHISQADPGIDRFGFLQVWDDGSVTPHPVPELQTLDYAGYLRWAENSLLTDMLWVTRRATFERVRMPDSRVAPSEYHLDFSLLYLTRLVPVVLGVQYTDSGNRLTGVGVRPPREKMVGRALDDIASVERILARHGEQLSRCSPGIRERLSRLLVAATFLGQGRRRGLRAVLRYAGEPKTTLRGYATAALCLLGPGAYLAARDWRRRITP